MLLVQAIKEEKEEVLGKSKEKAKSQNEGGGGLIITFFSDAAYADARRKTSQWQLQSWIGYE